MLNRAGYGPIVRNIAPIDPLDDIPMPAPLRPTKLCDVG
jgi:hypothetical protein